MKNSDVNYNWGGNLGYFDGFGGLMKTKYMMYE
jgi:hypothetical protein